ncbi:MAG: ribbon-helix-helix domain-containing protein [Methanomicrobiales archaeon]|nr:ribbon-helix-helix domain-containing protein [Methanomicrobiales archaeon]
MAQITATIDDTVVKEIDHAASQRGISRSRWVALAIQSYLTQGEQHAEFPVSEHPEASKETSYKGQGALDDSAVATHDDTLLRDLDHMRDEVTRLMHELEGKNQVIKLQSDEIGWLRGECAKLTDRVLLALPAPRKHWWAFWRRE